MPHFHPEDAYLFLTWRLWGSLPVEADSTLYATPGHAFAAQDRVLDRRASGPLWLKDPLACRPGLKRHFDGRLREALLSSLCLGGNAEPRPFADSPQGRTAGADEMVERINGERR